MHLYKNKYRIESTRLQGYDYGSAGLYFVTICTYERFCYFGKVRGGIMGLSGVGAVAHRYWAEIPDHFDHVRLDAFIVMPNHVHGILALLPRDDDVESASTQARDTPGAETFTFGQSLRSCHETSLQNTFLHKSPSQQRQQRPQQPDDESPDPYMSEISPNRGSLGVIIRLYKGAVTRWARRNGHLDFAWQPRFYDHIIRDDESLHCIRNYITHNPLNWEVDRNHPDNLPT